MPVVVDFSRRIETELQLVGVVLRLLAVRILIALARVGVTSFARPLYLIRVALEVAYADAEVVEFIGELSSELVDQARKFALPSSARTLVIAAVRVVLPSGLVPQMTRPAFSSSGRRALETSYLWR